MLFEIHLTVLRYATAHRHGAQARGTGTADKCGRLTAISKANILFTGRIADNQKI
jgi:hypothetical protein